MERSISHKAAMYQVQHNKYNNKLMFLYIGTNSYLHIIFNWKPIPYFPNHECIQQEKTLK